MWPNAKLNQLHSTITEMLEFLSTEILRLKTQVQTLSDTNKSLVITINELAALEDAPDAITDRILPMLRGDLIMNEKSVSFIKGQISMAEDVINKFMGGNYESQ